MRLVCPNCDAEYEVDDAAVPKDGRDVQCSNCGHAWFQQHPEIEAEAEAEADLYEAPPGAIAPAAEEADAKEMQVEVAATEGATPAAEAVVTIDDDEDEDESEAVEPDAVAEEPESPEAAAADASPAPSRSLDETVLAVLREEAERETAARRAEVASPPVLESQTEMPMAAPAIVQESGMAAAVRRIARMRGLGAAPVETAEPAVEKNAKSRGQMFPAIDEINSTLRTIGNRAQDEDDAVVDSLPDLNPRRGGFRHGFLSLVVLAVVIVALYILAPAVAVKYPAMAGVAAAYVTAVDTARVWLDTNLRLLVAKLQDLAGSQGG